MPVLVRGTNWVPLDAFHSRDAERLGRAFDLLDDLGCNMVRCWGGNVYESDAFFDLCDERGILVWQDMAFACCLYPQTEEFLARVRTEAGAVARRLRNHPSLALWCGNNEIDMVSASEGLSPAADRISREVIPQALYRHDPHRHYVPSSPYVPPSVEGEPEAWQRTPEQHLWGPRGYYKAPFYTRAHGQLHRRDRLPRLPERLVDQAVHLARRALAVGEQRRVAGPRGLPLAHRGPAP